MVTVVAIWFLVGVLVGAALASGIWITVILKYFRKE